MKSTQIFDQFDHWGGGCCTRILHCLELKYSSSNKRVREKNCCFENNGFTIDTSKAILAYSSNWSHKTQNNDRKRRERWRGKRVERETMSK